MALSVIVIPGDGVTTQFSIPFALGYIKESDITARVGDEQDGTGNPIYRTLTFLSPTSVVVSGAPAPIGTNIVFRRTVDREQLIVDYEDGDIINEENMNTAQRQAIMLVHEVLDGRFSQFQSGFDMGGFNITGLGAPTNPGDATNKAYVDGLISDGAANAAIAVAARDAAIAARNAAQASQSAAATSASNAANSATAASASQAAALGSQNAASASQTAAAGSASAAAGSASAAGSSASDAQTSAQNSANSATAANTSAVNAATSQSAAASSATAADSSRTAAQTAQIRAYNWAQEAENVVVNDTVRTGYSAYHWSAKANASATSAAASAAAAATFDPSAYVAKAGSTMTGSLVMQNASATAPSQIAFRYSNGTGSFNIFGGVNADNTFRITNAGGSSLHALTTAGRAWFAAHGWLDEAFAQKNTYCRHYDGGVLESGSVNPGGGAQTHDVPSPYVMTGLRTIGGNNQTFLRSKPLFNTGG